MRPLPHLVHDYTHSPSPQAPHPACGHQQHTSSSSNPKQTHAMRIIINCTGGSTHSMLLLDHTTVQDVKEYIAEQQGTPVSNQALLFAGRHLGPDTALLLDELQLDSYSLAHEVVVYMQPQLSQPVRVYLCSQPGNARLKLHPEVVEASSTLANIQALLAERQLTCTSFPPAAAAAAQQTANNNKPLRPEPAQQCAAGSSGSGTAAGEGPAVAGGSCSVVVKRQDGSCCSRVRVDEGCTVEELLEAVWEVEGKSPTTLTFYQARDGCLHVMFGAPTGSEAQQT